ncbi:hypothetical protein KOW79_002541 [Hemibagrus wyckioides]|uniref:Uncharacterized protein n=1 Tax=Hemibagrus wyckioides TaxID=337641 RepID=A0A9D3P4X0_9TELE|nr:hypothetical protein KOW79_002541 [Hemibagrus wyckioides]
MKNKLIHYGTLNIGTEIWYFTGKAGRVALSAEETDFRGRVSPGKWIWVKRKPRLPPAARTAQLWKWPSVEGFSKSRCTWLNPTHSES